MKDKAFARTSRARTSKRGAAVLGLPLEDHIANVIESLRGLPPTCWGSRGTL